MPLQTGIFSELLEAERERIAQERRSSLENPQTPLSYPAEWLLDIFNGGRTDSGIRVSELTAFQATTFLGCVDLIAGSIAALPLHIYERSFLADGRAVHHIAYDHDLFDVIHMSPNPEMSRVTFIKAMMAHILSWGNGYAELQRDGANRIVAIWPRNPAKTLPYRLSDRVVLGPVPWRPFPVELEAGTLCYRTTDAIDDEDRSDVGAEQAHAGRFVPVEDMVHVPGLALDGRVGQSVVWLARQTLGLALATEKYGAKYFANYAKPGGILELPAQMTPEAKNQARQSWMEAQGGENSHRVSVMPPGFKWTSISNNPEEAQVTQTRQFIRNEICSIFHVPPHMMGDVDKGRSNTEQLAQEYVQYTLAPWLAALRLEFKIKLFPNPGIGRAPRSRFFIDFDLSKMLRPDAASREKYYATGRQWGFLNADEIREMEGLNPIADEGGMDYWMPVNMTLAETPIDPNHQDGAGNGDKPDDGAAGDAKSKGKKKPDAEANSYFRLFRHAFSAVLAVKDCNSRSLLTAFAPVFYTFRDQFAREVGSEAGPESDNFLLEFVEGMAHRAAQWTDTDDCARTELVRAFKALRMAVYREAATQKAKQLSTEN